jgi:hypothetical protein
MFKNWLLVFLLFTFFFSCKKGEIELDNTAIGVDPNVNIEMVNQLLQMEGKMVEGDLPAKTAAFGGIYYPIQVTNNDTILDTILTNYDLPVYIPFSIPNKGLYKIQNLQFKLAGTNYYWKVPSPDTTTGSEFAFSFIIPRLVKSTNFRIDFNAKLLASALGRKDSCITDSGSVFLKVANIRECGDTIIGSAGISQFRYHLKENGKAGPTNIMFAPGRLPDRIDVKYNGKYVASSCPSPIKDWQFPKCSGNDFCFFPNQEQFRAFTFDYDPAKSTYVDIFITGWCADSRTLWKLWVPCPKE